MSGRKKVIRRRDVLGGALVAATVAACRSDPAASARKDVAVSSKRLPTLYLPHGGGPCFFMDWKMGPPDTWDRMAAWLRSIGGTLPSEPKALLVVSAHWEERVPTVINRPK